MKPTVYTTHTYYKIGENDGFENDEVICCVYKT